MTRFSTTLLSPKVEFGPDMPGTGATKAVSPLIEYLSGVKDVLQKMVDERDMQEVRFILYRANTRDYVESRRRKQSADLIASVKDILADNPT